ncbi:hypothetical protein Salat_2095500 [Sesamum alatum]|uniref:Uncharacterized protein n=1 Tax=Sesamum alatum TaxID=300844 RepID=A0AAE1Y0L5_9LAMI|nr:hypothetical protein Salat_2095500 [Sesamum alatum]
MELNLDRLGRVLVLTEVEERGVTLSTTEWTGQTDMAGFLLVSARFGPKAPTGKLFPANLEENPMQVNLTQCSFHVHIHGLPHLHLMTGEMGVAIGKRLGTVMTPNLGAELECLGRSTSNTCGYGYSQTVTEIVLCHIYRDCVDRVDDEEGPEDVQELSYGP